MTELPKFIIHLKILTPFELLLNDNFLEAGLMLL